MKEWFKSKPIWLKGGIIGLIVGAFFAFTGIIGTFSCYWNPVAGEVVPEGLCSNPTLVVAFYTPFLGSYWVSVFLFSWLFELLPSFGVFFYFAVPSTVLMFFSFLIGTLIGLFVSKRGWIGKQFGTTYVIYGGLIGFIIMLILGLLHFIPIKLFLKISKYLFGRRQTFNGFFDMILLLSIAFIVGALIGWIIKKIKSRI